MNIPKSFLPDRYLDEKFERIIKSKISPMFTSFIYDSLKIIKSTAHTNTHEHPYYPASFVFNEGTEISFVYTNQPFFESEKGLVSIGSSGLGLDDIIIKSTIKNPIEAIEQTFSANPLNYKSLPFQMTRCTLNKLVDKDSEILKDAKQFRNSLIIDRIACDYVEKENCYKFTEGNFYFIVKSKDVIPHKGSHKRLKNFLGVKEKTFHTMSIYEVLPFTKKEKELLSNLEEFEISYRFPRPNENADRESKHLFRFKIRKKSDKYEVELNINDGFTSGLDLKSVWLAEKLFDYLNSERKMVCCDKRISKYTNGKKIELYGQALDPWSLYKEDAERFITYFSTKSSEEKKKLIEHMMDYDFVNEKVIAWLNEKETKLVREVGLKQG